MDLPPRPDDAPARGDPVWLLGPDAPPPSNAGGTPPPPVGRSRWHRRGYIVAGVVVLVAAWGAVVGIHLLHANRSLRAGIAAAQRARQELASQGIARDTGGADLAAAAAGFSAAHAEITSPWLAPLHLVPIVNTQIRSVEALSGAAEQVTTAGVGTLATVHAILAAGPQSAGGRAAAVRRLADAVAALDDQVDRVSLGPAHGLIGTLVAKRDTFAADLTKLHADLVKARGATSALADLLTGPRTYLIAATNNAEMRAGSGMILEAGGLTARDGRLALGGVQPTGGLVVGTSTVRPSGDLAARWGFEHPTLDFRELLLSPQFPANAALAAQMWQYRTGQRVDGVMTIDVAAVADLLGATGPLTLDGRTYTQADVGQQLLIDQYADVSSAAVDEARHEALGRLAALVFAAVDDRRTSITALTTAFDAAAVGRHIQVWSATPGIESDWTAAGVGGALGGDDLLVSLLNQGANKLDPYQQVTSQLTTSAGTGATEVTVRVTIHNTTPATLAGYPAGGAAGDPPARQYTGAVALELPPSAEAVSASGGPIEASGGDYGSAVVAVVIAVPQGRSQTVTFHFRLAGSSGRLHVVASARLPATSWSWTPRQGATEQFSDSTGRDIIW